ncbi:Protein kti12 [Psilocybe cubensis]|uniref:Protein kti12 n=1 Tax=Psilocybe cubensis TaxID=181762 RepID=A0ACB8HCH3_PSICU|nr:Protein kti12 [Psilocybe cubensis]KAH9485347.1 Protein kti12 [Psilocybe cubensis]
MALITIAGYPAAGKSTRAAQLAAFLDAAIHSDDYNGPIAKVLVVSDHSLALSPHVYDADSKAEKPARGALFAAVQRMLATDTILILDSLNYIKGFRYQLYCAARELKLRTSTNLFARFEEPSSMVRWDAPLFTVLWDDKDIPGAEIWDAITKGSVKPPNSGTLSAAKAPVDALHVLEQVTTNLATAIVSASSAQATGGTSMVFANGVQFTVNLPPRAMTLSELQRLKRQFVSVHKKAITLGTTERGGVDWGAENIGRKFVEYVEEHWR